jgi:hypothetical protein
MAASRGDGLELRWPGKYDAHGQRVPLRRRRPQPVLRERYGAESGDADQLWVGDNLDVLDALADDLAGKIDLAVLDPPFGTGGRFQVVSRVGEAGPDGKAAVLPRPAYDDRFAGGTAGLVAMLDPRLRFLHGMLAPTGSLYVHLDATVVHAVKLLLDEIFGAACFQRQIIWRIGWLSGFKTRARNWIRNHDVILYYTKDPRTFVFNKQYVPHPPGYLRRDGKPPTGRGMPLSDVWNANAVEAALSGPESLDSIQIKSFSTEKTGYATQKNESLLRRIIETSSNPGDLVADFFCGSGTTLAVARELGRRVVGADVGRAAVDVCRKRLLTLASSRPLEVWSLQEWARTEDAEGAAAALRQRAPDGAVVVADRPYAGVEDLPTRSRGRRHVAAWGFRLPAPLHPESEDAVCLGGVHGERPPGLWVGQRPLVYARTRQEPEAVTSWPRLRVRLSGLASARLTVELLGAEDPDPDEALAKLGPTPLDLIDAWTVDWSGGVVLRAAGVLTRASRQRTLQTEVGAHQLQGRGPWCLRVVAWDVVQRELGLQIHLHRVDGTLQVHEAWLR